MAIFGKAKDERAVLRISEELISLNPNDLDLDSPCLMWPEEPGEQLRRSIKEIGLVQPLIVSVDGPRPRLVAGYKRAGILSELGVFAPAREIQAGPVEQGLVYLADNAGRTVTDPMQAAAVRYFAEHLDKSGLEKILAPALDIQPQSRQWHLLMTWSGLSRKWDAHLEAGRVPLAAALVLEKYDSGDLQAVEPFFRDLAWSRSSAVNFLTWIWETARAAGKTVDQVVRENCPAPGEPQDLSPKDAQSRLLNLARAARYPNLAELDRRFEELRAKIRGNGPWRLEPARNFETGAVDLSVRVGSRDDLARAADSLRNVAGSELWDRVWTLADPKS